MLGQSAPQSLSLGQLGSDYIDDTDAHEGDWGILHALETAVFAGLESSTMSGDLTNLQLLGGDTIFGRFSSIELASGKIVAYKI